MSRKKVDPVTEAGQLHVESCRKLEQIAKAMKNQHPDDADQFVFELRKIFNSISDLWLEVIPTDDASLRELIE